MEDGTEKSIRGEAEGCLRGKRMSRPAEGSLSAALVTARERGSQMSQAGVTGASATGHAPDTGKGGAVDAALCDCDPSCQWPGVRQQVL